MSEQKRVYEMSGEITSVTLNADALRLLGARLDALKSRAESAEAELERTRAALAALVDATNRVYMAFLIGYTATEGNGLLDLYEAKDQANAVLPATQSSKTEAGQ